MRRSLLPAVLSLSLLLSAVATTYAASYTFTIFTMPGATLLTEAFAINAAGQTVGTFGDATVSGSFLATPARRPQK